MASFHSIRSDASRPLVPLSPLRSPSTSPVAGTSPLPQPPPLPLVPPDLSQRGGPGVCSLQQLHAASAPAPSGQLARTSSAPPAPARPPAPAAGGLRTLSSHATQPATTSVRGGGGGGAGGGGGGRAGGRGTASNPGGSDVPSNGSGTPALG